MRRVILLLIDGLRPDLAETQLALGNLPALGAMLGSGSATRGITAFPSTTTVAYLPFLTGCTPGHGNVPSIRWLDRAEYRGRWWHDRRSMRSYCGYQTGWIDDDLAREVPTVFELVPQSGAIFTPVSRGLGKDRDPSRLERKVWGAVAHYAQWHQPSDDAVSRHLLRAVDRPWRFIFAQFPAVDGYTHQSTPDGPKVVRALHQVDRTVALLRQKLAQREELAETLILVVSDHGASPVHSHLDLADWFRDQGVPTLSHPVVWERNPRAAVMVAGNGSAMVYARPGIPREQRWPMATLRRAVAFGASGDLVARLVTEPAVAFVAAEEGAGQVRVAGRDGEALITRELSRESGELIRYAPESGDPLELGGPLRWSAREWLETSWDSPYPDACFQLLDQFRSNRTGDLVVVAREGFDFRKRFEIPEHKCGHGSLIRAHMQVPVWSSAPGLTMGEPLRTVDLFPAMLDWLGVPVPAGIDGRPVWLPARTEAVA
jgi:Type I phosphodiesterase / nucleotide pyrophosphatase